MTAPQLYDLDEAASRLNVSRNWIARAVSNRLVECTRLGKHIRFTDAQLQAVVEQSQQPAAVTPRRLRKTA